MAERRFTFDRLQARFRWLVLFAVLCFAAVLVRLVDMQVIRSQRYMRQAEENRIRPELMKAHRGRLLDRYGRVLADNAPSFHLSFDPRDRAFRENRASLDLVARELATVLGQDPDDLAEEVEAARRAGSPPITIARSLSFETLSALEERMEHLPGVEIRPEPARRYPYGSLAAHLIGYVGEVSESDLEKSPDGSGDPPYQRGDLIGRSGVERSYERWLRGRDGIEYVEVDAFGRRTNLFEELPSLPSIPGDDVVLTIDLDVQLAAEAALDSVPSRLKKQFGEGAEPRPGCVVAIDARNGEVLAMASRPAFDPNLFIGRISKADWAVLSGDGYPLLNRPIQASYPPGSTFKALTGLAVLHEAGVTPSQPMPSACGGGLYFGNRYFRCHLSRGHGSLGLIMAMAKSCDVYFYQCGIRLGVDRLTRYAEACSVGVPTRVDLPQERSSLVPTLAWFKKARGGPPGPGAALNLSIGQGELLLTPIQIARLYAAIANGGTIVRPHTALRVVDPNGKVVEEFDRDSADEASLPATGVEIAEIQRALEAVVMDPGGTGKQARVGSFRVAGKTGTSQNPHGQDHALFVGYAPADAPEIVVVVVLEQSGHGGAIAAPTAQPVLQTYLMPPPKGMATAPIGMAAAPKAMAAPKGTATPPEGPATPRPAGGRDATVAMGNPPR